MSRRTHLSPSQYLRSLLVVLLILMMVVLLLVWPGGTMNYSIAAPLAGVTPNGAADTQVSPDSTALSDTAVPGQSPEDIATSTPGASAVADNWITLSLHDAGYAHLFAYQPYSLPLTRLTNNPWDDMDPAISPDGTRVAFRSRQNGFWDIFILDLNTGEQSRLTDTPEFDGSPSWSPDGSWLVYETYLNNNLELMLRSTTDAASAPIQLTDDPAADFSPSWSPTGRQIAFISDRSGDDDVWIADLDQVDNRFSRLAVSVSKVEASPEYSPDGRYLAWSVTEEDGQNIVVWDTTNPAQFPRVIGSGDFPTWDPSGATILATVADPNQAYLTAYPASGGTIALPTVTLPGGLHGMNWHSGSISGEILANFSTLQSSPIQSAQVTSVQAGSGDRLNVSPLDGITAPYAYLMDEVDESFYTLQNRIGKETGWDLLTNLENAYVPLTTTLSPGMEKDWLYTGRAFTFISSPINVGWMAVVRNDFGGQTYWRVYLKTRYQDGSMGEPMRDLPWDLNARGGGDPAIYEAGGKLADAIPTGYWVDLTDLANRFGWTRVPALINWRTYYQGAHFNELVQTGGLDWKSALLQLYPPEIFETPPSSAGADGTPTPNYFLTETRVAINLTTPTITPTSRSTWTPVPTIP